MADGKVFHSVIAIYPCRGSDVEDHLEQAANEENLRGFGPSRKHETAAAHQWRGRHCPRDESTMRT